MSNSLTPCPFSLLKGFLGIDIFYHFNPKLGVCQTKKGIFLVTITFGTSPSPIKKETSLSLPLSHLLQVQVPLLHLLEYSLPGSEKSFSGSLSGRLLILLRVCLHLYLTVLVPLLPLPLVRLSLSPLPFVGHSGCRPRHVS